MLEFKNPLDTDVDRPGWNIGDEDYETKLIYAGPKYGMKSKEEYNKLLQSGSVSRGQQAVELYGEQIFQHAKNLTPDKVKDFFGGGVHLLGDFVNSKAGKVTGTIYDIALKPTVDQTMNILGAPVEATHWVSKKVDTTGRGIGKAPLSIAETGLTLGAGAIKSGGKALLNTTDDALRLLNQTDNLALATVGVNDSLLSTSANIAKNTDGPLVSNVFAFTKQPRTPAQIELITASRQFKPKGFNTNKWDNYITKFGSREGAEAAVKKAEESAKYLAEHGNLKGNNNLWTDPVSGRKFLVKNKAKRGEISIGFDSLDNVSKTLAKRIKGQRLNINKIKDIGKQLGWDDVKIQKYIETNEQAERTLKALIRDLNKGEGRTMWSLGHRTAVKELPHSADRALNIELEPLIDVLTKEGRKIKGNTGRAANDELIDLFKKITNNPVDLEADMIHWGDSLVGNFMPRMREIKNADDFFKEIVKREDFLNKIKAYSKKNKVNLEEAADVIIRPLIDKTKVTQPTYFD